MLHSTRDILRHGPARGYDTCPTESNHRPLKNVSHNTQRIKSRFEEQTAKRLYEKNVIDTSWKDSRTTCIKSRSTSNQKDSKSTKLQETCGVFSGTFHITRNLNMTNQSRGQRREKYTYHFRDARSGKSFDLHECFPSDLLSYVRDHIFSVLDESVTTLVCFNVFKTEGRIIYYGSPVKSQSSFHNSSWAQFEWDESDNCPGKCILFVDLTSAKYKQNAEITYEPDMHVIIQSLQSSFSHSANNIKIAHKTSLYKTHPFYCVSVHTISNPAFVIPDLGNSVNDQFIYVFPRHSWKLNF